KLHDIGNTVAAGVKSVAGLGASFLTVHAYPQVMAAAVAAREHNLRILAVTVLTSLNDGDLKEAGYATTVAELAARRAARARDIGVDGLVCSPQEAANLRRIIGAELTLVTPGIRPAGSGAGDQKRVATPAAAIAAGADYLVVGRPIRKPPRRRSSPRSPVRREKNERARVTERDGYAQRLLDSADRYQQPGRLQGLYGGDAAGA